VALNPELTSAIFGLSSAALWGAGDFSGGFVSKRANVFGVTLVSQAVGLLLMIALALFSHEPIPSTHAILLGCAAGLSGSIGVALFYRALAVGKMGIAAPIAAVITAIIPVTVGMISQGLPGPLALVGFGLAFVGVWLLSRSATSAGRPQGLGLAVLAGFGFGGFLVFLAQTDTPAVFWALTAARTASVALLVIVVLSTQHKTWHPNRNSLPLVFAAGVLDVGGNILYLLATQSGRLDVAAVLASLYPAFTVILARGILKEHIARMQLLGVVIVLVAIPLITVASYQ